MDSTLKIPLEVVLILQSLHQAGYEGYLVGGSVRDLLRSTTVPPKLDYDFTTNATPEQLQQIFPDSYYENEFGTVSLTHEQVREHFALPVASEPQTFSRSAHPQRVIDVAAATKIHPSLAPQLEKAHQRFQPTDIHLPPFQITTFRSEAGYEDHRRPTQVQWGDSLDDDLSRRDFTINAMALSIKAASIQRIIEQQSTPGLIELTNEDFVLHDPFGGLRDLEAGHILAVGDPNVRFQEDALRLLRAVRFSVQLSFVLATLTMQAIKACAPLLQHVSAERIRDEFLKILISPEPKRGLELLDETGLLALILPELLAGKGVQQGGHHTTDVWTHSLDAVQASPSSDPIVRLATLLHDIAKPQTFKEIDGNPTFYNHEIVGSRMAKAIAQRLRLSKSDCERIFILVRYHMFHYQPELTDAAIRRMMRNIGLENIDDMLDLREADRLGSGARKTSWRLEELKQRMIEQLHQPLDVTDLAVNGNDLMTNLQMSPGPQLGRLLQALFAHVSEHPEDNEKDTLLELAKQKLASADSGPDFLTK